MRRIFLIPFLLILFQFTNCHSQKIQRKAHWGGNFSFEENLGLKIVNLSKEGSLSQSILKKGDTIMKIGEFEMNNANAYRKALRYYKSSDKVKFKIKQGKKNKTISVIANAYPYEKEKGLNIVYHKINTNKNSIARVIETKPQSVTNGLPTIIFIPWLSCGSVEKPVASKDGWIDMFYGLAKSGFNVIRIEKPGVGDSTGPDCSEYGFNYELEFYTDVIRKLLKRPYINKEELFIWGGSMGGSMAPIIINNLNLNIKGLIISGSFYKTWYEHMLEIERRMADLNGNSPEQVNNYMIKVSEFYTDYLINKKQPTEIMKNKPHLREIWNEDTELHQYGRPVEYYIEANTYNIPEYWSKVNVPVLVIHGEYDWVMTKEDHLMIVNHLKNKNVEASFISIPRMDHNFNIYKNLQASFDDSSQKFDMDVLDKTSKWIFNVLDM